MSTDRAFPVRTDEAASRRCSVALHGMALNALFPPPARIPGEMMGALEKLDRVRR